MNAAATNIEEEEPRIRRTERNKTPLYSLSNPTHQQLSSYTKTDLQKHCDQLGLGNIWMNKDKLIEKLLIYYRSIEEAQVFLTENNEREDEREISNSAELFRRFENFMRETKDNFLVVNNSLAEKEKEIDELKTKLFFAEETIKHLQETLQKRTGSHGYQSPLPAAQDGSILLIGDSSLKEVKSSDLQENVIIRTLPEANMSLLKSWITEKLDHSPNECIIYCGTQDLLDEDQALEKVLDSLGTTIAKLKEVNDEINVKVCELVPALEKDCLNTRIDLYNSKLVKWCNENGVTFIKTQEFFKLGTGDVDTNCYESQDGENYDLLNRTGAIRLLDAISSICTDNFLCHDWKNIKSNLRNNKSKSFKVNNIRGMNRDYKVNRITEGNNKIRPQQIRYQLSRSNYPRGLNSYAHGQGRSENMNPRSRYSRIPNREGNDNNHEYFDRNKYGCYNCGEFNHRQTNCRFDHRIRCNVCYEYGHKGRLCKNNIQY